MTKPLLAILLLLPLSVSADEPKWDYLICLPIEYEEVFAFRFGAGRVDGDYIHDDGKELYFLGMNSVEYGLRDQLSHGECG